MVFFRFSLTFDSFSFYSHSHLLHMKIFYLNYYSAVLTVRWYDHLQQKYMFANQLILLLVIFGLSTLHILYAWAF